MKRSKCDSPEGVEVVDGIATVEALMGALDVLHVVGSDSGRSGLSLKRRRTLNSGVEVVREVKLPGRMDVKCADAKFADGLLEIIVPLDSSSEDEQYAKSRYHADTDRIVYLTQPCVQ